MTCQIEKDVHGYHCVSFSCLLENILKTEAMFLANTQEKVVATPQPKQEMKR
jgi:hypothetical protein